MKNLLLIFLLSLTLYSCSSNGKPPTPPYDLKYSFHTEKNYQYVYRLILNNADSCSKQGVASKMISEGQLYSDIKSGDITMSLHAPFGKYTHLRIKIETNNGKTNVAVSNEFERWDELAKVIKDWVINETSFCR
ncbi:MAG: hypothetical protein OEX19_04790 [Gammaproteobacteria bacterium]|nr:hypothetical protein [Gammaproteobacteria bacterium]